MRRATSPTRAVAATAHHAVAIVKAGKVVRVGAIIVADEVARARKRALLADTCQRTALYPSAAV